MFANIWKRNRKEVGTRTIAALTSIQRADILTLRDQGLLPSVIARELGLEPGQVSTVIDLDKRVKYRQEAEVAPDGSLKQMQMEIAKLKLEREKQQAEWELEDRKAQREHELFGDGDDDDEQDSFNPLEAAVIAFLTRNQNTQPGQLATHEAMQPAGQQATPTQLISLTDEEILEVIKSFKPYARQLQKMPESVLQKMAAQRFPQYDDDTRQRAVEILKGKRTVNAE
jgi:hypothetical protein